MEGAWTVCRFKGGIGKKEGGGVFEGGDWYPNAHYDPWRLLSNVSFYKPG